MTAIGPPGTPETEGDAFAGYPFVHRLVTALTKDGMRVLEVGSGAGYYGRSVRGTWIPTDVTREPYPYRQGRPRTVKVMCRAESLPFAAGVFDFAFSVGVMHQVADHVAAVAELRRALTDEGAALILTYSRRMLARYVDESSGRRSRSPHELARLLGEHGFEVRFVDTDEPRSAIKRALLRIPPVRRWRRTHGTWVGIIATARMDRGRPIR